jgi:predicted P-loop ATPase
VDRRRPAAGAETWRARLHSQRQGRHRPERARQHPARTRASAVHPTYDAFRREIRFNGEPADDVALDRLWLAIDDTFHFRPPKGTLYTVVVGEAHAAAVHPVRAYLDRIEWDGIPRLDEWLVTYGGAGPPDYVHAVGALVLIAAVRRVRAPGCQFDELLILESPQAP